MSKNKGAVLIPESQLTDEELEEITGGLLPAVNLGQPILIGLNQPTIAGLTNVPAVQGLPTFNRSPIRAGDGCGTDDSGTMGCPG